MHSRAPEDDAAPEPYRDDVRDLLRAQGWTEDPRGALRKNGALWVEANDVLDSGLDGAGYSIAFDSGVPAAVIAAACEAAAELVTDPRN